MDVSKIAPKAQMGGYGFWETGVTEEISYTKDGHNAIQVSESNSFWFEHRKHCVTYAMEGNLQEPVLDVGGGNGLFTKYLQDKNISSILLEPGVSGALNAVGNGVEQVINGSLYDAGVLSSSVGSVVLLDVLEHIEDDEKFLLELNRILREDGQLFLTVPAFQYLYSSFDKEVGHFRRYTLASLEEKMVRNGFIIDYKSYFFSFLPLPILIGRFLVNKFKKKSKRKSTGHMKKSGLIGGLLQALLWPEQVMIKKKLKIPFGSSCLIIAKKAKDAS